MIILDTPLRSYNMLINIEAWTLGLGCGSGGGRISPRQRISCFPVQGKKKKKKKKKNRGTEEKKIYINKSAAFIRFN